jgi:hypothetical protein
VSGELWYDVIEREKRRRRRRRRRRLTKTKRSKTKRNESVSKFFSLHFFEFSEDRINVFECFVDVFANFGTR